MRVPLGMRRCPTCQGLGHTPIDRRAHLLLLELAKGRAIRPHAVATGTLHARVDDVLARETGRRSVPTATNNALVDLLGMKLVDRYPGAGPHPDRWVITPVGRRAIALRRSA